MGTDRPAGLLPPRSPMKFKTSLALTVLFALAATGFTCAVVLLAQALDTLVATAQATPMPY